MEATQDQTVFVAFLGGVLYPATMDNDDDDISKNIT